MVGSVACPASSANVKTVCGVGLRTLHVGGEENRLLPLRDELTDGTVDHKLLRVSTVDPHGLVRKGEYHALLVEDRPVLAQAADTVAAVFEGDDAVQ